MKYHKQKYKSILQDGIQLQIGSCYPTAIACLLDLEVDQVPNFQLLYFQRDGQRANLNRYLRDLCLNGSYPDNGALDPESVERYKRRVNESNGLWDVALRYWLASEGYEMKYYDLDWYEENPGKPYMLSGMSPRGFQHVVIYQDGKMIHDPHPDGTGLVSTSTNIEVLEKF